MNLMILFDNDIPDIIYPVVGIGLLLILRFGMPALVRSARVWVRDLAAVRKERESPISPRAPVGSAP